MDPIVATQQQMVVGILGPVVVWDQGHAVPVHGRLERAVLAHLVLAQGRALAADSLIDVIWGARPPKSARNALQVKVSHLRRLLPRQHSELEFVHGAYRLHLESGSVDSTRFSRLVAAADSSVAVGQFSDAEWCLEEADVLWRGAPLAGLEDEARLEAARRQLLEEHVRVAELRAEIAIATSSVSALELARLRKAVELDPFRARSRLLLMKMLDGSGCRSEALSVYDEGRRVLADVTGLEPAPELQEFFVKILDDERSAAGRASERSRQFWVSARDTLSTTRWLVDQGDLETARRVGNRAAVAWMASDLRAEAGAVLDELSERLAPAVDQRLAVWGRLLSGRSLEDQCPGSVATSLGSPTASHEWMLAIHVLRSCVRAGLPVMRDELVVAIRRRPADRLDPRTRAMRLLAEQVNCLALGERLHTPAQGVRLAGEFASLGEPHAEIVSLETAAELAEAIGEWGDARDIWASIEARGSDGPGFDTVEVVRRLEVAAMAAMTVTGSDAATVPARHPLARAIQLVGSGDVGTAAAELRREVADARRGGDRIRMLVAESLMVGLCLPGGSAARTAARRLVEGALDLADARALAAGCDAVVLTHHNPAARRDALHAGLLLREQYGVRSLLGLLAHVATDAPDSQPRASDPGVLARRAITRRYEEEYRSA